MAIVRRTPSAPIVRVKNLGWLLRNYGLVKSLEVTANADNQGVDAHYECELIAHLHTGGYYYTLFASRRVLWRWLDRPILRGLPLSWLGHDMIVGSPTF